MCIYIYIYIYIYTGHRAGEAPESGACVQGRTLPRVAPHSRPDSPVTQPPIVES